MDEDDRHRALARNVRLYPWFKFFQALIFWQAIWFLYYEGLLSPAAAIALLAIKDLGVVVFEVPSGYLADAVGRRPTLLAAAGLTALGCVLIATGNDLTTFMIGEVLVGMGAAFASGADSALLYDSLDELGETERVAEVELRAWRLSYAGYALSAVAGGLAMLLAPSLPYLLSALAAFGALIVTWRLAEPPISGTIAMPLAQLGLVLQRMTTPLLAWVLVHTLAAYVMGHVAFAFAQPYVAAGLAELGLREGAPMLSGTIAAIMFVVSIAASMASMSVRRRLGPARTMLAAFAMQTLLIAALAAIVHPAASVLLVLRLVPDAFIRPYMLELVQPELEGRYRATYLSVQNLAGKLVYAGLLLLTAGSIGEAGRLEGPALTGVLTAFAGGGAIVLVLLIATRRHAMGRAG
ncbi:MAG: MFS transporter [Rhizobiales bacterium]|nr:MFS transporter [Hyphomicrobiales bacterium]